MLDLAAMLEKAYAAFNARDIDSALDTMHPDVRWANGMKGGFVRGHDAVRAYWTRQWEQIDPQVEPIDFTLEPDGRIVVDVHQVVRDLSGNVVQDQKLQHAYTIKGGKIRKMEIQTPPLVI